MSEFNKNSLFNTLAMSGGGLDLGNPYANMMMMMALGPQMANRPAQGSSQSVMDAMLLQRRTQEFMRVQQLANSQSLFAQKLNLDPNSQVLGFASMMFGGPDGAFNRFMSPLIGGNPVKAQMGLFANLTGHTTNQFSNLRGRNISVPQTTQMMDDLYKEFYTQQDITPEEKTRARDYTRNLMITDGKFKMDGEAADRYLANPNSFFQAKGSVETSKLSKILEKIDIENKKTIGMPAEGKDRTEHAAKVQSMREEGSRVGQAIIDSVTDTASRDKMRKHFTEAMSEGVDKSWSSWSKMYSADAQGVREALSKYQSLITRGPQSTAINFETTRGFQIEDITSGFSRAADLRLLPGGRTNRESFAAFVKDNVGTMDAARSLFGHGLSGAELMDKFSGLAGRSSMSAGAAEDMMRDIKSGARSSGISTEDILALINQAQQVASTNPQLAGLTGNMPQLVMTSLNQAMALDAVMGPEYTRRNGGMPGLTNRAIIGNMESMTMPGTKNVMALKHFMDINKNEEGQKVISEYLNDPNRDASDIGFNKLKERLSKASNMSMGELGRIGEDSRLAELGQLANPGMFDDFGANALFDTIKRRMSYNRGNISGKDRHANFLKHIESGTSIEEAARKSDVMFIGQSENLAINTFEQMGGEAFIRAKYNPAYKAVYESQREIQKIMSESEKDMSKRFGILNAPVMQGIFNQFLSGKVGKEGVSSILETMRTTKDFEPFRTSEEFRLLEKRIDAFSSFSEGSTNKAYSDYYNKAYGLKIGEESFDNLFEQSKSYGTGAALLEASRVSPGNEKLNKAAVVLNQLKGRGADLNGGISREGLNKVIGKELVGEISDISEKANDLRLNVSGKAQFDALISRLGKQEDAESKQAVKELQYFAGTITEFPGTKEEKFNLAAEARIYSGNVRGMDDYTKNEQRVNQEEMRENFGKLARSQVERLFKTTSASQDSFTRTQDAAKAVRDNAETMGQMVKVLGDLVLSLKDFGGNIVKAGADISSSVRTVATP